MPKAYEYITKANIFDDLQEMLDSMKVDNIKRGNIRWLYNNLGDKNSDHPKFNDAMEIIKKLLFVGVEKKTPGRKPGKKIGS